jgi:hypothetical protein
VPVVVYRATIVKPIASGFAMPALSLALKSASQRPGLAPCRGCVPPPSTGSNARAGALRLSRLQGKEARPVSKSLRR